MMFWTISLKWDGPPRKYLKAIRDTAVWTEDKMQALRFFDKESAQTIAEDWVCDQEYTLAPEFL